MTKERPIEGDVKRAIKVLLAAHGWFHFSPPANAYGISGISDILALKRGIFLAIEVKLKKTTGSTTQQIFQASIKAHGGLAIVVNMSHIESGKFEAWLQKYS